MSWEVSVMMSKKLSFKKMKFFSPFNMAVLRKDLTRFMGVWIAYCVITLLDLPSAWDQDGYLLWHLSSNLSSGGIINGVFALVVGLCLFGDLYKGRLCNALHALPVRRETWLASHVLAGLIFWIVPFGTRTLFYILALGENCAVAALWLLGMAGQYLFYLSLAVLCAVCAGTRVGMAVMYGLINFGSILCYGFITTVYEPVLVGIQIPDAPFVLFSPAAYLMDKEMLRIGENSSYFDHSVEHTFEGLGEGWWYIAIMSVLAVGLIALAVFAYRRRRLEAAGEMVAFRPLKIVLWLLMTLTCGILVQAMGLLMDQGVASLVVGLVLGGMLAELLMYRNAKGVPKGLAKGAGVAGLIGLTILVVSIDPVGITRWKPKAENVESVIISDYFYFGGEQDGYSGYLTLTDPESIEKVIQAHGLLIKEGKATDPYMETEPHDAIHITYKLSNGTEKIRRYYYERSSDVGRSVDTLWNDPRLLLGYEDWNQFISSQITADVWGYDIQFYLNVEQTRELLTAIKTDCQDGTWVRDGYYYGIQIGLDNGVTLSVSEESVTTTTWLRKNFPGLYQ